MQYGALHMPPVPIGDYDFGDEDTVLVSVPKAFKVNMVFPGKGSRVFDMSPGVQRVPVRMSPGDGTSEAGPEGWYLKANGCRVLRDNDQVQRAAFEHRTAALTGSRGGSHPLRQVLPPVTGRPSLPPGADAVPYPAYHIPVKPEGVTDADWAAHERVMRAAGIGAPDSRTLTSDPDWEERMLAEDRARHGEPPATLQEQMTGAEPAAAAVVGKAPPAPEPAAAPKPSNGGKLNPAALAGDKPAEEKKA
jgi:hypothetical protein